MTDFRESVARLVISGNHVGSAWMVSPSIVCTAEHCVVDYELNSEVELKFPTCNITGTVVEKNVDLDIALIEVDPDLHQLNPLQLIARPIRLADSTAWKLHGYPVQQAQTHEGGLTLEGTVSNARSGSPASPLMQLYCQQGGRLGDQNSPFGGVSGCPVVVRPHGDDEAVYVIGFTSHHNKAQDDILYCTPIDAVIAQFGNHLQDTQLKSWDASRRFLSVVREGHGFRTNLDADLIASLWQDGLTGLWCDLLPDESLILTSVIERIVVNSPFATARPNTELHFEGASAWKSRCECCATDWVPVDGVPAKTTLAKYTFVELGDEPIPLGGLLFPDLDDLAKHVKLHCNNWALKRLRTRVGEAFDNPLGELQYDIASDLVVPMRKLWDKWLKVLQNDSDILHHFFGLMLNGDGGVLMTDSAAGAGPVTIDACVLRATIFSLALCIALPPQLGSPRGQSPGNLGHDEMSGHSCGIQTLSGKRIQMADRSHTWKTLFVMLPQRQIPWEEYRVAEARLDKNVQHSEDAFHQKPASSLVLPGDLELMSAIEQGLDTLKRLLGERYADFLSVQEQYVEEAINVNV